MNNEQKKYLFVIDLDGTTLGDSMTGEIAPGNVEAIKRARKLGHVICIATGRPWRSTQKAYEALGLDTVVANYNGAHIHNPTDYDFSPEVSYMNLNDVMYILGDAEIKKSVQNIGIEGPGWVMVEREDADLERVFGFKEAKKYKIGMDYHKLPLRPTGVILDTKPGINLLKLKDYLQRTYGDLAEFSSWSKGEGKTPVLDMTNVGVTKAKVLPILSRYYDIPMRRTIAIGDGYNDVPMFMMAEFSVAVANASDDIKEKATHVSKKNNKEGAVAEFINQFLDDLQTPDTPLIKKLKARRKEMLKIKDNTNPAS